MINLLEETKRALEVNGKKESDIAWVGSHDGHYRITWEEFATEATKISYNPESYDCRLIAKDLVIVGKGNWWLSRTVDVYIREYDGGWTEERWEFNTRPITRQKTSKITIFTVFIAGAAGYLNKPRLDDDSLKSLNEYAPPPDAWQLSQGGEVQISGVHTDGWER